MGHSDYLFTQPGYWEGVARIFDSAGALDTYNSSPSPEAADVLAREADWVAVGVDLNHSLVQYREVARQELARGQAH